MQLQCQIKNNRTHLIVSQPLKLEDTTVHILHLLKLFLVLTSEHA